MGSKTTLVRNILCFTLMFCCRSYRLDWTYDFDFSKLPVDCEPRSCSETNGDYARFSQNCDCSETCSRYGTCCFDSPHATLSSTRFVKRGECSKVWESSFGAFMVSNCNPRWRGHRVIRTLCEGTVPTDRDPLSGIPVTNTFSTITYKNFFCSLCNFDQRGGILWNVLLTFPHNKEVGSTQDERKNILRTLEYNRAENRWGIWNKSTDSNAMEFVPLKISAEVPPSLNFVVKLCDFNLESRCARTWNDETVRKLCESYLAPITLMVGEGSTSRVTQFRNPHCAICNYVTGFDQALCFKTFLSPSLSFTLLIDVNPSDGDKVGENEPCGQNEVHDPFFKKCRALVCALPGYTVKNGQCTNT